MDNEKSKQLNIEIPPELHKRAKLQAVQEGRSVKDVLQELIRKWLNGEIKLTEHKETNDERQ